MIDKDYLVTKSNNSIIYQVSFNFQRYPKDWVPILLICFLDNGPFLEMKNGSRPISYSDLILLTTGLCS